MGHPTFRRLVALALAALPLFVVGLGNVQLRDWDEATFAQVAREMSERGDWLRPTYSGEAYLNKPPLLFWLMGASFSAAGASEVAARLPGALLTALGVPLLYLAGRQAFRRDQPALAAAIVYLTLLPVVRHGRLAMIDGMVNTFLIATIFCLIRGITVPRWLAGAGLCLGLIALAKGALALALGGVLLLFVVVQRERRALASSWLWIGLALGSIPTVIWYGLQAGSLGSGFLQTHVVDQGLARVFRVVDRHDGPPWFYAGEIVKLTLPWLLFTTAGVAAAVRARQQTWARLIIVAGGCFLAIISLMPTKLPWYLMPCHVFIALGAGWYAADLQARRSSAPHWLVWGIAACAIASGAGLVYLWQRGSHPPPVAAGVMTALTCVATALLLIRRRRAFFPVLAGGLYLALFLLVRTPDWNWEVNEAFDVRPVAALVHAHVPPGAAVRTTFAYRRPSLDFYAGRPIRPLASPKAATAGNERDYLLIDQTTAVVPPDARVLGRAGTFVLVAPSGSS